MPVYQATPLRQGVTSPSDILNQRWYRALVSIWERNTPNPGSLQRKLNPEEIGADQGV